MKPNKLSTRRGQAMLEFAVMASVALLALGLLIQIGLRMNYQQEIEQQTFRRAMRAAVNFDVTGRRPPQAVTYYHYRDRQMPDPSDGFAMMPRMTTESRSMSVWGKFLSFLARDDDSRPRVVVNLNGTQAVFNSDDLTGQAGLVDKIARGVHSEGGIITTNQGTNLVTTTTTNATMTLNTKGNDAVSSELTSQSTFNW